MSSQFIDHSSSALSDGSTKKNIISTPDHKLRIVGRYPSSGSPNPGTPFSIDVEVQTNINEHGILFRIPFWCPDATVVVRAARNNEILGQKFVSTRFTNSCTGRENIQFKLGYYPSQDVYLEVYSGEVRDFSNVEPAAVSNTMNFSTGLKEGRASGQYDVPYDAISQITSNSGFQDLSGILTKVLIIGGVGVGLYFTAPLLPMIKNKISNQAKN